MPAAPVCLDIFKEKQIHGSVILQLPKLRVCNFLLNHEVVKKPRGKPVYLSLSKEGTVKIKIGK